MPYSVPWITKRCRCSPPQPNTVCTTACRPASVVSPGTSNRRQISGLIPATMIRSRYTTAGSPTAGSERAVTRRTWPSRDPGPLPRCRCRCGRRRAQVLVEGLAADPELPGQAGLGLPGRGACPEVRGPLAAQGSLAALVDTAVLGQRDALPLSLTDQCPFELGERSHDRQQQGGHRGVLAGEDELLFGELHGHAPSGQLPHDPPEVLKVAGQAVHRVHDDGVALADEAEHRRELRTSDVFARRGVGEVAAPHDPVQLPANVLVEAADPDVGDSLPAHCRPDVSGWTLDSAGRVSNKQDVDPIVTHP